MNSIMKIIATFVVALCIAVSAKAQEAPHIGQGLLNLNPCLYGDCEARGSYAADPFGWPNPGTLAYLTHFLKRGVTVSGGGFFLNAGDVNATIASGTATFVYDPVVFQVNGVKATGDGFMRGDIQGLKLDVDIAVIRMAAAADLSRFGLTGLSVGVLGALPVVTSRIDVTFVPLNNLAMARVTEERSIDLTVGLHYRAGYKDWFMAGAYVNGATFTDTGTYFDLEKFNFVRDCTDSHAWYGRVGVSLLPFQGAAELSGHPIDDAAIASSPLSQWFSEFRFGVDWEHRNITAATEGTMNVDVGYFGIDTIILPDAWNPASSLVRFYAIAGVDTKGGYGYGVGLYGNPEGILAPLSINLARSSRPLAPAFGHRVDVEAVTASLVIPF